MSTLVQLLISLLVLSPAIIITLVLSRRDKDLNSIKRCEDDLKNQSYSFKVGARLGLLSITYPFVNIKLSTDQLLIQALNNEIKIYHEDIISIQSINGFPMRGIKVLHNRTDLPKKMIIWSRYTKSIYTYLQSNDWICK